MSQVPQNAPAARFRTKRLRGWLKLFGTRAPARAEAMKQSGLKPRAGSKLKPSHVPSPVRNHARTSMNPRSPFAPKRRAGIPPTPARKLAPRPTRNRRRRAEKFVISEAGGAGCSDLTRRSHVAPGSRQGTSRSAPVLCCVQPFTSPPRPLRSPVKTSLRLVLRRSTALQLRRVRQQGSGVAIEIHRRIRMRTQD